MALMAENSRKRESHDIHRASRKAEEAALRRYQAVHWLECVVGPLGITSEPTEIEFISCLRNGIILCNVINKIQPGTISKVVDNHVPLESESAWDLKPLPAYQYFENVRNFLVAVEELKLPGFEASDLERENFEAGSAGRIADCILALKSYHEWKQWSGGKGVYKHVTVKSPLVLHSTGKNFTRPLNTEACRQLDISAVDNRQSLTESIVKALSEHMVDSKENMNTSILATIQKGNQDPDNHVRLFSEILSRCLEEKLRNKFPALNSQETLGKTGASQHQKTSILRESSSMKNNSQCSRVQSRKGSSHHWSILLSQEKDLTGIKALWSETKREFEDLRNQLMKDLNHLGSMVEEMANPARGYQRVIQENRKLYNMVQDLKGNIRVYCRIRPMFNAEAKNAISLQEEDGRLLVFNPSKPQPEERKEFQFNRVYGPTATQDELFKDAQPLIRSVMDGYNVCILAYGQTGSGKTYTMFGPSGVTEKEMGINFFALNDLFQTVGKRKGVITCELNVQMVEICNEQIRDLLADVSACQDESTVPNVTSQAVMSHTEAINLVRQGEVRRTSDNSKATTNLSKSSHSVVTIHVQGKDLSGNILRSRLHLVDLAGNGEDDQSLTCLEDVITSLSQKTPSIQNRDSKLTSLLQGALGAKAKVLVFAHVIPEGDSFENTVSTLTFAQRISTIELGAAQSNKMNSEVMELKNEIETLRSALRDVTGLTANSPLPTKQVKSPCDKPRVMPQKTPVKSRRLSMEDNRTTKTGILPKSPIGRPRLMTERTPPRPRRLSIENTMIARSEKTPKMKEPKSPYEGKKGVTKLTPPRTRRLSIENPSSVKPDIDNRKGTKAPPQTSLRARRLSLEGPKDKKREILNSADPKVSINSSISIMDVPKTPPSYRNGPTFTDCAAKYSSLQQPKTPEQNHNQHVVHPVANILTDTETPGIAKSTTGKRSQFKKSLRTIGKLINGSEKRNQQKLESTSTKGKDIANGAKSPTSSKARVLRRQSLTNLPPPGTSRTSLGGMSTDARPIDNRNAKTPPSVCSSTTSVKRWM